MAGAGYRLFNTGDVLTAAQVNTFLQEQVVMVFANATARTTALSGVLAEGMMSYLQDTNQVEVYNGSAWVGLAADQTPLTTKGDLFTYSTTDTRLGVGANGTVLTANSATATGLEWAAPAGGGSSVVAGKNFVLNGDFGIWQRGTSFAITTKVYTADRWDSVRGSSVGGHTVSRQTTSDTTNLPNIQYCARVQRDSGNTGTQQVFFAQSMESVNSIPLAGKQVTLSFYARRGANYSSSSNALVATLFGGTGTDQNYIAGYTGVASQAAVTATLTTTWTRFTTTGTVGTNITELAVNFSYSPTGTAGAADYFEVTGVQVEVGASATDFSRAQGTTAEELAACQRYYYRFTADSSGSRMLASGVAVSTSTSLLQVPFPVSMRIRPTALEQSGTAGHYFAMTSNSGQNVLTAVPAFDASTTSATGFVLTTSTGLVAGNGTFMFSQSASAYLGWSAEL